MYFPFLRGKQNELFAISELADLVNRSNKVMPIIEPDNLNATSSRVLPNLNIVGVPYIFIINPLHGKMAGCSSDSFASLLRDMENKQILTLGYFITDKTTFQEIRSVMNIYSDYSFALIHTTNSSIRDNLMQLTDRINFHIFFDGKVSTLYKEAFKDKYRVLIRDSFHSRTRNVDYPPDEYFSDLFSTYHPEYSGFGDLQTIGAYKEGGGPAYAVAIHLTYLKEPLGGDLWVKHFISDDTKTTANVQGKYFQALRKLIAFTDSYSNTPETVGIKHFRNNLTDGNFPGLGIVKRWSIKHHIELMTYLI